MIKRLGNLAAACALTALPALSLFTPGAANAAPLTATKNFDVSATVSAIATITFDRTSFTWGSSDFTNRRRLRRRRQQPGNDRRHVPHVEHGRRRQHLLFSAGEHSGRQRRHADRCKRHEVHVHRKLSIESG